MLYTLCMCISLRSTEQTRKRNGHEGGKHENRKMHLATEHWVHAIDSYILNISCLDYKCLLCFKWMVLWKRRCFFLFLRFEWTPVVKANHTFEIIIIKKHIKHETNKDTGYCVCDGMNNINCVHCRTEKKQKKKKKE